eukprot:5811783-Prymnesium_polylepis.2
MAAAICPQNHTQKGCAGRTPGRGEERRAPCHSLRHEIRRAAKGRGAGTWTYHAHGRRDNAHAIDSCSADSAGLATRVRTFLMNIRNYDDLSDYERGPGQQSRGDSEKREARMGPADVTRRERHWHKTRVATNDDEISLVSVDARLDGSTEDEVEQTVKSRQQPAAQVDIEDMDIEAASSIDRVDIDHERELSPASQESSCTAGCLKCLAQQPQEVAYLIIASAFLLTVSALLLPWLTSSTPSPLPPAPSPSLPASSPSLLPLGPNLVSWLSTFPPPSLPTPLLPRLPPPPPPARPHWPASPYNLYTGWEGYRLGDMFLWFSGFKKWALPLHLKTWPESLVAKYANATQTDRNYEVLANIIRTEPGEATAPDVAVVHLRIGDIFEDTAQALGFIAALDSVSIQNNWSVPDFFNDQGPFPEWYTFLSHYSFNRSFYEDHLKTLQGFGVRKVILMAGAHIAYSEYPRSSDYIDLVRDLFFSHGFQVESRFGRSPDDDAIFASRARYFVQSGGGLSAVLANLCRILGGTVLCSRRHITCDHDTWSGDKVGRR